MQEIIEILMRRDGITYEDAKEAYLECKSELMDVFDGTSCLSPEDVLMSELGLEPDYIFNFI
jgi:hypothetical protein